MAHSIPWKKKFVSWMSWGNPIQKTKKMKENGMLWGNPIQEKKKKKKWNAMVQLNSRNEKIFLFQSWRLVSFFPFTWLGCRMVSHFLFFFSFFSWVALPQGMPILKFFNFFVFYTGLRCAMASHMICYCLLIFITQTWDFLFLTFSYFIMNKNFGIITLKALSSQSPTCYQLQSGCWTQRQN